MTMSSTTKGSICRVIAAVGCGFALAACSMSMPSFDFFKSTPTTEVLRIESEPPGADARTSQGQTCRTPCELTVPTENELAVTVQMSGYQPQTLPVRADGRGGDIRLQPNPVYVELQPATPVKPAKPAPAPKKKTSAAAPAPRAQTQAAAPTSNGGAGGYPWPPAPQ
jgi:PEGA domain-containing protein